MLANANWRLTIRCARILFFCVLGFASAQLRATEAPGTLLMLESKLPPKKTVQVFGQRIAYNDVGVGPILVLVHEFASEARFDWGNVIVPLAKNHRVIAPDLIGLGASDTPLIDNSIQTFIDSIGEFLRALRVRQFSPVGESLGCIRLNRSRPQIRGLCLANTDAARFRGRCR